MSILQRTDKQKALLVAFSRRESQAFLDLILTLLKESGWNYLFFSGHWPSPAPAINRSSRSEGRALSLKTKPPQIIDLFSKTIKKL